jgi:FKBP-type peptidyl-prolyl cis-trans isomerase FkpA
MLYLKKGAKVKLVVPPQLGYGDYDLDDIPPNSVLLFDIEVKEVL